MTIDTATVSGVVYAPDGEPIANGTGKIGLISTPNIVGVAGGAIAPFDVEIATDGTGQIGKMDGGSFTAGVSLSLGQYVFYVTSGDATRQALLTVDENAITAVAVDLEDTLGEAPAPAIVTAAQVARDAAQAAQVAAETAQAAAETAATSASSSASTAQTAATNAVTAKDAAVTAQAAAETAETAAEAARVAAETARTGAETAETRAKAAETGAQSAETNAQTAETGAVSARNAAQTAQTAAESAQTAAQAARVAAEAAQTAAETAQTAAEAARDKAQAWAETPEDTEVEIGAYSALHHAAKAGGFATQAETFAAGSELRGAIGTLSAALGQVAKEQPAVRQDVDQAINSFAALAGAAFFALRVASQVSGQVNGGRVTHAGGTLADPAVRIGTVGLYSAAADTLSIAIGGAEVARFTSAGLTIYGTVTEA